MTDNKTYLANLRRSLDVIFETEDGFSVLTEMVAIVLSAAAKTRHLLWGVVLRFHLPVSVMESLQGQR